MIQDIGVIFYAISEFLKPLLLGGGAVRMFSSSLDTGSRYISFIVLFSSLPFFFSLFVNESDGVQFHSSLSAVILPKSTPFHVTFELLSSHAHHKTPH